MERSVTRTNLTKNKMEQCYQQLHKNHRQIRQTHKADSKLLQLLCMCMYYKLTPTTLTHFSYAGPNGIITENAAHCLLLH